MGARALPARALARALPALAALLALIAQSPAAGAAIRSGGGASGPQATGSAPGAGAHGNRSKGSRKRQEPPAQLPRGRDRSPLFAVTMPPVGLSIEYPVLASYLGGGSCPPPALSAVLRALGSPPLRIGGNSQDMVAPAGAISGTPDWESAILYSLPASFWSALHCLLVGSPDRIEVGLNAKQGGLPWAQAMVADATAAATAGVEFSIGNEPDLYYLPNFASLGSYQYNEAGLAGTYLQVAQAIRPAIGAVPLIGPELARASDWRHQLPRYIAAMHPQTIGVHLYPLSACGSSSPTIAQLLSAQAIDAPEQIAWVASIAAAAHLPAIISEANSAACGGAPGISDAPASAVWAIGFVLSALESGFREVRFHSSGGYYDPFVMHGGALIERPLLPALEALNALLPIGSAVQALPGVRNLIASVIHLAGGRQELVFIDDHEHAQRLLLYARTPEDAEVFDSERPGAQRVRLLPHAGRIEVRLAAESALIITS
ncbi:MAG TPA: hypothetical protein VKU89_10225 [Solirubrobacteraceae bacterium]|nr:hypothetical protein [Solirubrobacteraceae bacterium]